MILDSQTAETACLPDSAQTYWGLNVLPKSHSLVEGKRKIGGEEEQRRKGRENGKESKERGGREGAGRKWNGMEKSEGEVSLQFT